MGNRETTEGASGRAEKTDQVRQWMADYGAPLVTSGTSDGKTPALELVLADALAASHTDATLARTLPVVLWRNRATLRMDDLVHLATRQNEARALGFFLELTFELSGEASFAQAADALRDRRFRRPSAFFHRAGDSETAREVAEANTPAVARRWHYLMNMPLESFSSMFEKAAARKATFGEGP